MYLSVSWFCPQWSEGGRVLICTEQPPSNCLQPVHTLYVLFITVHYTCSHPVYHLPKILTSVCDFAGVHVRSLGDTLLIIVDQSGFHVRMIRYNVPLTDCTTHRRSRNPLYSKLTSSPPPPTCTIIELLTLLCEECMCG